VKTRNAIREFYTDRLLFNEISMLGVLSSDWVDTERALALLRDHWRELRKLCTHAYPIGEAERAVRVLGREIADGSDPVHIHLDTTQAP